MRLRVRAGDELQRLDGDEHQGHAAVHGARGGPGEALQPHRRPLVAGGHLVRAVRGPAPLLHKLHLHADQPHRQGPHQVPRRDGAGLHLLPEGPPEEEARGPPGLGPAAGAPLRAGERGGAPPEGEQPRGAAGAGRLQPLLEGRERRRSGGGRGCRLAGGALHSTGPRRAGLGLRAPGAELGGCRGGAQA